MVTQVVSPRCDSKQRFRTEAAARLVMRRMKRVVLDPFRLSVYFCPRHNGWHIGNKPLDLRRPE